MASRADASLRHLDCFADQVARAVRAHSAILSDLDGAGRARWVVELEQADDPAAGLARW